MADELAGAVNEGFDAFAPPVIALIKPRIHTAPPTMRPLNLNTFQTATGRPILQEPHRFRNGLVECVQPTPRFRRLPLESREMVALLKPNLLMHPQHNRAGLLVDLAILAMFLLAMGLH